MDLFPKKACPHQEPQRQKGVMVLLGSAPCRPFNEHRLQETLDACHTKKLFIWKAPQKAQLIMPRGTLRGVASIQFVFRTGPGGQEFPFFDIGIETATPAPSEPYAQLCYHVEASSGEPRCRHIQSAKHGDTDWKLYSDDEASFFGELLGGLDNLPVPWIARR